jgi:hypothetical protein
MIPDIMIPDIMMFDTIIPGALESTPLLYLRSGVWQKAWLSTFKSISRY